MRLATVRTDHGTVAARIETGGTAVTVPGFADVGALLAAPEWRTVAAQARGPEVDATDTGLAPVIPRPGKIVCVGLNYATHIREMGRELPEFPTLFAKWADALAGPYDTVEVPDYAAAQLDWEGELALVIGTPAYRVPESSAGAHIAGYAVIDDYTMRDYQYRTTQWDQGKNLQSSSGFGPWLDTDFTPGGRIETRLDGELMQSASTSDLVFAPEHLVAYISSIVRLNPGDVVITGTTGGVGHAREPARYIADGQTVEVSIEGLGSVRNPTRVVPSGA
ncbi:fumarylacetoacetate hydrolase family protein [Tsukamurella pseudospumae]|uniref:2-hydroxyhepta-2,4-diene-1,7-dioate isomerase n=1 Tax=Tsukamurella pseudospumae TaxID=239498 RepID=A0A138AVI7_9ACTN|nr:fumarylacetoacetate hydrolase family protein [Tsukamurella pseudospumae]KXP14471.1 2-hydroxyhepta-2,4-diene-1,7-dioate isomerase [Tsukamurella pseudospumae]